MIRDGRYFITAPMDPEGSIEIEISKEEHERIENIRKPARPREEQTNTERKTMKFSNEIQVAWKTVLATLPASTPRQTRDTYQVRNLPLRPIPGRDLEGVVPCPRFDDQCKNGHNSFGMTATVYALDISGRPVQDIGGGCCHDAIVAAFPELEHLVKWHLTSTDGPMHYLANTCFHAGNRDCWGRAPGDPVKKVIKIRMPDLQFIPHVEFEVIPHVEFEECDIDKARDVVRMIPHAEMFLDAVEWSEGKPRELDAARLSAVWPEATDEELMNEHTLPWRLIERLPGLMAQFKADMEAFGFKY